MKNSENAAYMNNNLKKAAELLKSGNYTFAAVNSESEITSHQRGVKPLLELLDSGQKLCGFSIADKVIGKAAAFLYVLLKPDEIHANVISRPALEVLEKHGIAIYFDTLTEAIRNRTDTGFCPMETAVKDTDNAENALDIIKATLKSVSSTE